MSNSYQPLHHKYRPSKFDELVGQDAIKLTLKQALKTKRIAPAYLFSGPRGTGKTSSARILARSLNCLKSNTPTSHPCGTCETCQSISTGTSLDVIEIDAASNTGVDNIRELIERSRFAPVQSRWKVYVIDECHMLSTAAFNALLKTLEEPPPNVVFVLATTDPQRVLSTILSRCQRFDFQRIAINDLKKHLQMISSLEEIKIESEAVEIIAQLAEGGLRDAESMLDQLSLLQTTITTANVWDLAGVIPEQEILIIASSLIENNPVKLIESCRKLINQGREPVNILQGLASVIRDLILILQAPDRPEILTISKECRNQLKEVSLQSNIEQLIQWQSELKGTENQIRNSMQPRLWLEVLLLGTLAKPQNNQTIPAKNTHSILAKSQDKDNSKNVEISNKNDVKIEKSNLEGPKINDVKIEKSNLEGPKINDVNLEELWQEILGRLDLPSTRMLLSQQARLVKLNNEKAIINVADNWIGMVQSRIGLLKQAVKEKLGSEREIVIESQLDRTPVIEKQNKKSENIEVSKIVQVEQKKDEKLEDQISINKAKYETKEKKISKVNNIKNQAIEENKSIDTNAKKIAEFFNGEILDN